ncbi:HTH-type transcriptional regulator LutR [Paenibacillus konkukensis]|uniref:HTH-type transcriptional regulator LutR n=1 Tax=Paenibacillus konkukensis TaxID=2020716 RepID=A0ABY4RXF5_9BACL|nr:FadR/GntR family transcriptional regulator [Paenibacillus konkukensis]UQZ86693.1 HTH-type transcriptional regulator LutR [Paenibacillus konkukensis]
MMIRKAYEVVADAIRERIRQEEWPVGSRLPSVEKLAVIYGVGRSTIREALMSLKAHGWVDMRHGGGTFVLQTSESQALWQPPQISDVRQLKAWLELRFILETESAGLAASRRSEAQLGELDDALQAMASTADEEALEQADIRFHTALAGASGNPLLQGALESLFSSMGPVMIESRRLWLFAEQSATDRLSEEHRHIVEAVRSRDASAAKQRMAQHLRKVEQVLERLNDFRG